MYGIDFGTSNTVVTARAGGPAAVAPAEGAAADGTARPGGPGGAASAAAARVLDLGEGGVLPSLLYFERDRRPSIGAEAMADYAAALSGSRGQANLLSRFRFFQAIKLALKDPYFEGTRIFGDYVRVEALAALFLRETKRRADEALAAEGLASGRRASGRAEDPAREDAGPGDGSLVLGRPVRLSEDPAEDARLEGRFREAALLAGFDSVDFVYEPVAASVDALDGGRGRGTVLVFDFGGGTLDISVARGGERGVEILSSAGMDLGGYLLNEDLARARIVGHFGAGGKWRTMTGRWLEMPAWITNQVASFYALPLADLQRTRTTVKELVYDARREDKDKLRGLVEFLDRNLAFELFARIDGAKIELSGAEESSIAYAVPPYIEFEERLARADFEALVAPRVEAARLLVLEALAKAGVEAGRVDRVVRVGGSSRVPAFVRMLEGLFSGRVEEGAVFTSIASGLIAARDRGLVAGA